MKDGKPVKRYWVWVLQPKGHKKNSRKGIKTYPEGRYPRLQEEAIPASTRLSYINYPESGRHQACHRAGGAQGGMIAIHGQLLTAWDRRAAVQLDHGCIAVLNHGWTRSWNAIEPGIPIVIEPLILAFTPFAQRAFYFLLGWRVTALPRCAGFSRLALDLGG